MSTYAGENIQRGRQPRSRNPSVPAYVVRLYKLYTYTYTRRGA